MFSRSTLLLAEAADVVECSGAVFVIMRVAAAFDRLEIRASYDFCQVYFVEWSWFLYCCPCATLDLPLRTYLRVLTSVMLDDSSVVPSDTLMFELMHDDCMIRSYIWPFEMACIVEHFYEVIQTVIVLFTAGHISEVLKEPETEFFE